MITEISLLDRTKVLNNMLGCEIDFVIKGLGYQIQKHRCQPERCYAEETSDFLF